MCRGTGWGLAARIVQNVLAKEGLRGIHVSKGGY